MTCASRLSFLHTNLMTWLRRAFLFFNFECKLVSRESQMAKGGKEKEGNDEITPAAEVSSPEPGAYRHLKSVLLASF